MNVEYGLACVGVAVEDGPITTLRESIRPGEITGAPDHLTDQCIVFRRQFIHRRNVPAGNHQHVHRRLAVDVLEGDEAIVLVDVYAAMNVSMIGVDDLHPTVMGFGMIADTFYAAIMRAFEAPAASASIR